MAMMFQTLARTMDPRAALRIECEGCGRRVAWTKEQACRRLGPDSTPHDVRRRLRCSQCDSRTVRVWI